jgi:aminoglycoside phosphotransferase family enzyme/predicted kinase
VLPPQLDGLLNPAAYTPRPQAVELRETHISWVLLAGDTAYKLKKAVELPFLSYGSLERRRDLCHEEVVLNTRLAPGIYRRVRAIVPAGDGLRIADESEPGAIEYAVEMRRYDENATLSRLLATGAVDATLIGAVGARIAAFHGSARIPRDAGRTVAALEAMVAENFSTLQDLGVAAGEAADLAAAFLEGRRGELLVRAASGLVRDGHGDLRAEHVVLESGIEIVDCVEFDAALREIDTGLDLAFLAMDLLRAGRVPATALVDGYRAAGGSPGDDTMLLFFAALRALIRAKVALIRASQVSGDDASRRRTDAEALLDLADRLGWQIRLGPLVAICGPAATGKTTLAGALGSRSGGVVLSSDVVRKELLGLAPTERAPLSAYHDETNRRTYAALGRAVADRLARADRVLVDATFRYAEDRHTFAAAAGGVAPLWIECRAPVGLVARRAAARTHEAVRTSDADRTVAVRTVEQFEPLDEVPRGRHVTASTAAGIALTLDGVRRVLDDRLRGSGRLLE